MSFDPVVRASLLETVARQQRKGRIKNIDPIDNDLPIKVVQSSQVPMRGNLHFALGRTMSRAEINRKFAKG